MRVVLARLQSRRAVFDVLYTTINIDQLWSRMQSVAIRLPMPAALRLCAKGGCLGLSWEAFFAGLTPFLCEFGVGEGPLTHRSINFGALLVLYLNLET